MKHSQLIIPTLIVLRLASAVDPLGFKSVTIEESGEVATFEWYQQPIDDKSQAAEFCELHGSSVPEIRELKYFFKSLTLQNSSIFYLNDVIETTVDSPNEAIGERMCITVRSNPGHPVSSHGPGVSQATPNYYNQPCLQIQFGETSAVKSCKIKVNANICRRTTSVTNSTLFMKCLEVHFKETEDGKLIKLNKISFYFGLGERLLELKFIPLSGAICLVLLMTICLCIALCYKYCLMKRRMLGRGKAKGSALFSGSEILKPIGLSPDGSDLGRYDLLPDVPLQCSDSCRRSRRTSGRRGARTNNLQDGAGIIPNKPGTDRKSTEVEATGFL
ncbi:unnamed protein product [Hydatigera taeniaeformis]|uniref:C2-set_2 domain-containing protein n=1 Tax=Hydatigena taeniaeformis TaxID=6205 RepID=A0A0R3WLH3_HYDTA|nr:unnamed protein product [Hydatigera taeniaeformis]